MNTDDTFKRICDIFEEARALAPEKRRAFLEKTTGNDKKILNEVQALLTHHDQQDGLLDKPVLPANALNKIGEKKDLPLPKQFGQYQVLERLGTGGMGVVYLARQSHPVREVAIKVMRSELVSAELEKRFELESTLLGRLQHPGIAQIFEAGLHVEDGQRRPFFVMEYVQGPTLREFIRTEQPSIRTRLSLFQQIANAVQHAHQKGVIHRDLKPNNILIQHSMEHESGAEINLDSGSTGSPNLAPKILDFGVARSTDADLMASSYLTDLGQLVGTLPYMSPEQVNGRVDEVDTRSDVYALGVILYEMLAGELPYELNNQSIIAAARTITESQPKQLSSINKSFRGDINTIVQKALEKDPERRYVSAADLASDVHRYLTDQPVFARPASKLYQIRKFAKRNKALVGGILTTFAVLLAGIATTAWQANDARVQRGVAIEQANDARTQRGIAIEQADKAKEQQGIAEETAEQSEEIAGRLYKLIMLSHPAKLGSDVKVVDAMKVLAKSLDEDPPSNAFAEHELRNAFAAGFTGMGETNAAVAQLTAAAKLANANASINGASTFSNLGLIQVQNGQFEEARKNLLRAIDLIVESGAPEVRRAKCLSTLGSLNMMTQKYDEAEVNAREALAIYNLAIENPAKNHYAPPQMERGKVAILLGSILSRQGKIEEAETQLQSALEIAKADFGEESMRVGECLNSIAVLKNKLGKPKEAAELLRQALQIQEANFSEGHPQLAFIQLNLGQSLRKAGELQEAEVYLTKSLKTLEAKLPPSHPTLSAARIMMGDLMVLTEQFEKAEELFQKILDQNIKTFGRKDVRTTVSLMDVAKAHERSEEFDQAISLIEEVIEIRTEHHGKDHSSVVSAEKVLSAIREKQTDN